MPPSVASRRIGLLVTCLIVGTALRAQQSTPIPQENGVYTLHEDTHLVLLDVTVTDKSGHPVTGLTQNDFKLLEDGQPQTIKFFEEHAPIEPAEIARERAAALAAQQPNTFTDYEPLTGRPVTVLLLNQLFPLRMSPLLPSPFPREMLDLIQKSPPDTPFAVYVMGPELQLVQPVTTDRALLTAKIQQLQMWKTPSIGLERPIDPDTKTPMLVDDMINTRRGFFTAAAQQLAAAFRNTPGRKVLYAFTGAFQCSVVLSDGTNGVPPCPEYGHVGHDRDFLCGLEDTLEQGRIWIYRYYRADAIGYGFGCGSTGASLRDLSHYYTLYFTPTNQDWSGRFRATAVEVAGRKELNLAYRRGYYGTPENVVAHYYTPQRTSPAPVVPVIGQPTITATPVAAETTAPQSPDTTATDVAPKAPEQTLHRRQNQPTAPKPPPNPASSVFRVQVVLSNPVLAPVHVTTAAEKEQQSLTLLFTMPASEFKVVQSDSGQYVARLEIRAAGYADGKSQETYASQVVATFNGAADPRIANSTITAKLTVNAPGRGRSRWLEVSVRDMATGQFGSLVIPMNLVKLPAAQ